MNGLQSDCNLYFRSRLCEKVFKNPTFESWLKGTHRLHLFLDSFDECRLRIDTLATLLISELQKCPVERLSLRIACRTADWPNSLEKELIQLWGNDSVKVYELAPLRRVDVVEAAKANNLNPDMFLREIDRMEVVPLAIKPITLEFLLNKYRQTNRLPSTQSELYLQGCQLLCEETNEDRRDAGLTGAFTDEERMAVAARIAAITVFARRSAIWTGVDKGDVPEEDVTIRELCGRSETIDGKELGVNVAAVREALATGLFSSRGPNRMGWAHQTYAEFLAAHYLVQNKMTPTQMMSLLVHPGDPDGKIVPQLHEAAAWLASMVPDIFRKIIRVDPEVLLRSDVATADVKDRAALGETLLQLYDEEKLVDHLDIRERYRKLSHPALAEQIRPYICDTTKSLMVRSVAIDIAEACNLRTLQGDLIDIALDPSQPLRIRVDAAYAVSRICDDEVKAKLKPLAAGEAGDDPDDELKGCGLRAVWPAHMTAKELFSLITPPKREMLKYWRFLSHDLIEHLQPVDLPLALEWVEAKQPRNMLPEVFEGLIDAIMFKAWAHLELPGVLEAFVKAALPRLQHYDEIVRERFKPSFANVLASDDQKRHRVVEVLLSMLDDPEDTVLLLYSGTPFVMAKDVPWLIRFLQETKSKRIEMMLAHLIERVFDRSDQGQVEAIFAASLNSTFLAETFARFFKPIELNSPEAQKMRASYLKSKEWQEHSPGRSLLKPPPAERIAILLDECESGNTAAWWRLNLEMTLEPDSTHYGNELEPDLTVLPGWKAAEAITRGRILEVAKKYVLLQDPETDTWLGTNTMHRPAFAGYRALRLLLQEASSFIPTIPASIWEKWAPIIVTYPISRDIDREADHKLVKMAYQYAPAEVVRSLMILIDKENKEHDNIFITRKVESCWGSYLADALLTKAKNKDLKPESMGCLLSDLLTHRVGEAKVFAESFVHLPLPSSGEERSRAIVAARVLMTHAEDCGWSVVWPAIQQDTEFGRKVMLAAADHFDRYTAGIGQRLSEDQLANLYIWLVQQFPYAEDPQYEEAHYVEPRENVANWRDSLLRHLKERGTDQAYEEIRRIANQFPELGWLKRTLLEARTLTLRHTWWPPEPGAILKMAGNQQGRLVQGGDQLLDVLVESLNRLEVKLQGDTPAAIYLWNEIGKKYWPMDEGRFVDYVKIHLDEDLKQRGVIVNREVVIRRGTGNSPGERTDIHVDAVVWSSSGEVYDSVTAIIEAKGCWNSELDTAMETQLVGRYLKDNQCQHGLYLIGWFNCDQWDDGDSRKQRAPKLSIDEAQKQFAAQAAELSRQGVRIKALLINAALR